MRKFLWICLMVVLVTPACTPTPAQENTPIITPSPMPTSTSGAATVVILPTRTPVVVTPVPEDDNFVRDMIFLEKAEVRPLADQPGLVLLHIEGQLPTPCHQFGSAVCPACAANQPYLIQVNVYSLIEKGRACRGPTTPFEQDIPLGTFTEGIHAVELNGQHVATFYAEKLGTADAFLKMERGNVFIEATHLAPPQGEGSQAFLTVQGFLPTPCHIFQAQVAPPDEQGIISIEAFSLVPVGQVCIDVVQDFTTDVPLGMLPVGAYSVWLNGEELGVVVIP